MASEGHIQSPVTTLPPLAGSLAERPSDHMACYWNTADNSSAARLILGALGPVAFVTEFAAAEALLQRSGVVVDKERGDNAPGGLAAIVQLEEQLGEHRVALPSDSLILTGGLTRAHAAEAADAFVAHIGGVGSVEAWFD